MTGPGPFAGVQVHGPETLENVAHGLGRDRVVMDFAGRIVTLLLDDAGYRTGRATHADEGQLRILEPGVFADFEASR